MAGVLGINVGYPDRYDPALLVPIKRADNRRALGISGENLPFCGADVWNAYELSWLDPQGKPLVARGRFIFPCTSTALVESKSLKLYLNSLNQEPFSGIDDLRERIRQDLSAAAGASVEVLLQPFSGMQEMLDSPTGTSLDTLEVVCTEYEVNPALLQLADTGAAFEQLVDEVLYTDLFRSRCPITGQPDWASVTVCYKGPTIDGLHKPEVIATSIGIPAPILPGTPTAQQAELLDMLDKSADADVHSVILSCLDRERTVRPQLFMMLVRRIGSLTTSPSAQRTPTSAPNCASRLSMSCRKSGVFNRVSALSDPRLNCVS